MSRYSKYLFVSPLNESLSTMGRQFADDLKTVFNFDLWGSVRKYNQKYLQNKLDYFNELFVITPQLTKFLLKAVKNIPNSFSLPEKEMDQFLAIIDRQQSIGHQPGHYDAGTGVYHAGQDYTYDEDELKELSLQRRARVNNGRNAITYSTCVYRLKDEKNKVYVIFFTFDSEKIDSAQVLVQNKYANATLTNGFDIVEIPEWASIMPNEYYR